MDTSTDLRVLCTKLAFLKPLDQMKWFKYADRRGGEFTGQHPGALQHWEVRQRREEGLRERTAEEVGKGNTKSQESRVKGIINTRRNGPPCPLLLSSRSPLGSPGWRQLGQSHLSEAVGSEELLEWNEKRIWSEEVKSVSISDETKNFYPKPKKKKHTNIWSIKY